MSRVKSDNRLLSILTGHAVRWLHTVGSATINAKSGEPFVLLSVVINSTTASAITLTDTGNATNAARVIANLKASVVEGTYEYNLPLLGSLKIDNPGGSDLTVTFSNN